MNPDKETFIVQGWQHGVFVSPRVVTGRKATAAKVTAMLATVVANAPDAILDRVGHKGLVAAGTLSADNKARLGRFIESAEPLGFGDELEIDAGNAFNVNVTNWLTIRRVMSPDDPGY